jgi:hypothetical protein
MRKERKWERNRNVEKLETLKTQNWDFDLMRKERKWETRRRKTQGGLSSENKRKKR